MVARHGAGRQDLGRQVSFLYQGRSRPTKVEAKPVKCMAETCWQEFRLIARVPIVRIGKAVATR